MACVARSAALVFKVIAQGYETRVPLRGDDHHTNARGIRMTSANSPVSLDSCRYQRAQTETNLFLGTASIR